MNGQTTHIAQPQLLSWNEAVQLYLHDPHAKIMLRRFAIRFIPIAGVVTVLNDFLLPGIGFIDNASWPFLIGGTIVMLYKINKYRRQPRPTADRDRKVIDV